MSTLLTENVICAADKTDIFDYHPRLFDRLTDSALLPALTKLKMAARHGPCPLTMCTLSP